MVSEEFRSLIRAEGARLYRDLPWRRTRDPYHIWLSEVMLQQTQVARVETRMPAWLERFPSVEALAALKDFGYKEQHPHRRPSWTLHYSFS